MREYTDKTQIENYLLVSIDSSFTTQISIWIQAVSAFIEKKTGRVFVADTVASERLYELNPENAISIGSYPASITEMAIDDCIQVTGLTIDGVSIDSSSYLTYPANSLPIRRIKLTKDSGLIFTFDEQNIGVTAKWGYSSTVTVDLQFAATILAAGIIQGHTEGGPGLQSIAMGGYSLVYKNQKQISDYEQALSIIDGYKRIKF